MRSAPAAPFASRLARVRAALQEAALDAFVVTHPPNLRYLTGFTGTAGALVVTPAAACLVVDFRYLTAARELVRSHPDLADLEITLAERSLDEAIVARLGGQAVQRTGIEGAWMSVSRFSKLSASLAAAAPTPLNTEGPCPALVPVERIVERARLIKDASEVALLREAAARLADVAVEVPGFVREGRSESAIAGDIDAALRRAGFERPAFETIVASGPNSALPHARPGRRILQAGDGVVLDFGGVYDGYCVDLTRTVQLPPGSAAFRRMFEAVAAARAAAIEAVRPGVAASQIDAAARTALGRSGLAEAFGHGTGHGLGLEVHEEPRVSRAVPGLPDVTVEAGMVFTIEPGAYVPGVGGVRIEDDVLVVEGGCEVLTNVAIEM
jgi:Xaa-Pro aminopeptidase